MITDAQVHLYAANTPARPWPASGRVSPPLKHPTAFTPEEMLGAMEAIGVDRAVIVPPAWAGEEHNNAHALAAAERYAGRFAVMGRLDPYDPASRERLEHWRDTRHMLGIRMSGRWNTTPTLMPDALADPALEWYWAACERLGIPLMILTGQHVSRLAPIAERHPHLRLVVDHLSTVGGGAQGAVADGFAAFEDLVALAPFPGITVKVGTGPNHSRESYPFNDIHPYLRRLHGAFGARRLLWEADFTQLTKNTYAECLRLWQEGLPFLTAEDRDWILGRAAAEVLNWPQPA